MIQKFIYQILLYSTTLLFIVFGLAFLSSQLVSDQKFKNSNVESNLLIMPNNKHYDLLFLGISHARNFSKYGNHKRVEKILSKTMINLGQGKGRCGTNELYFYLDYFYSCNNSTNTLVYVVAPPLLFSKNLPVASDTFEDEPLKSNFFWKYLSYPSENKYERLLTYVTSKLRSNWFKLKPDTQKINTNILKQINNQEITAGITLAYGQKLDEKRFKKSALAIERAVILANKNQTKTVFIIPPAIFGQWPGHNETMKFLHELENKYGIKVFDFSEVMKKKKYYYDHHHLNSKGIDFFTRKYLSPYI